MLNKVIPKSEFSKSVLTLMSGTIVAQALPIIITPILTRLYSPAEFGIWALFISMTVILGTIASGRYELAIMLPENDEDALGVAALGMIICTVISILLIIPVFFYNDKLIILLKNKEIGYWLYFIPFVVWMTGLFNVLTYLNNRQKLYSEIAKAQIYKSVAMVSVQLIIGFIQKGALGLVSGQIVSHISSTFRLMKSARK